MGEEEQEKERFFLSFAEVRQNTQPAYPASPCTKGSTRRQSSRASSTSLDALNVVFFFFLLGAETCTDFQRQKTASELEISRVEFIPGRSLKQGRREKSASQCKSRIREEGREKVIYCRKVQSRSKTRQGVPPAAAAPSASGCGSSPIALCRIPTIVSTCSDIPLIEED